MIQEKLKIKNLMLLLTASLQTEWIFAHLTSVLIVLTFKSVFGSNHFVFFYLMAIGQRLFCMLQSSLKY